MKEWFVPNTVFVQAIINLQNGVSSFGVFVIHTMLTLLVFLCIVEKRGNLLVGRVWCMTLSSG